MNARELLDVACPLNPTFVAWCVKRGTTPSLRQARMFKAEYPQLFVAKVA